MSNTDKLLEEIIEQRHASDVAIAALREWIAQHSEHDGALASLELVATQLSTEIVRCDALSGAGRELALANKVIRQNNAQLQAEADVHRMEIEQLRDERAAHPVAIIDGDDGSARDDRDLPGLTSGVVDILDDPRMNGVGWSRGRDVSRNMLDGWPGLWERKHPCGVSFETFPRRVLIPGSSMDVWFWRPLRLPGMGPDGVVRAKDMTPEHFARCEWEIRIHGQWIAQGAFHVDTNYPQRWRPVGWPDVEEGAGTTEECNCPQAQRLTAELAGLHGLAERLARLEASHDMLAGELWARMCNESDLGHPNKVQVSWTDAVRCPECQRIACAPGACASVTKSASLSPDASARSQTCDTPPT